MWRTPSWQAIARPDAAGATYELGGPRIMTFPRDPGLDPGADGASSARWSMCPRPRARLLARLPFSGLTSDQLLLLERDNVADPAMPGLAELGIMPTPIELIVPGYLARYRKGGARLAAAQ